MKGVIHKTDKGWVIKYFPISTITQSELHIHPDDIQYCEEGKEVEFIPITDAKINMVQEFAKLTLPTKVVLESSYYSAVETIVNSNISDNAKIEIMKLLHPPTPLK